MDRKRAKALAKSLIVDIDGVLAGEHRPIEDRHSAAASAAILTARLLGGVCVNIARIAAALEDIADSTEELNEHLDGASVQREQAKREVPE